MLTYEQLSPKQQDKAREAALEGLLEGILGGAIVFNDELNGNDLQARIDAAVAKADRMQTPWFAHEYILDTCRDDLEGMALCDAEDTLYAEPGQLVARVPA